MKIKNTQITIIGLFLFMGLIFIYGCKKEEPLEPNPLGALMQNEDYAGDGDFGGNGDTTGTGGGGGGVTVNEHFTVEIDGVMKTYANPMFQSSINGDQIISNLSLNDQIQITRFSGFQVDTFDYPTVGFFKSSTEIYTSIDGRLIIDSLTSNFIKGSFYCKVVDGSTADTIALTNGSFKIAK